VRSSDLVGIVSRNKVGGCEYSILYLIVFTCASSTIDEYDMYGGMMHVYIICRMIIPHHTA